MLSINTNLSSIIAQRSMKQSTNSLNQAIERMTTGAKINHAKDNAANYNIATNMTIKLGALQVAEDNCAMGLDMLATAESSLDQIEIGLIRLRDLAIQAQNGTYGIDSLKSINFEAESILDEMFREYENCSFNDNSLLQKSDNSIELKRVINQSNFVEGEVYYLTSKEDLVALQDLIINGVKTKNVKFELINDIDMSGVDFRGIGESTTLSFRGIFNGNGHVISNLEINSTKTYTGLFGYVDTGTITNLGVENAEITSTAHATSILVGGGYNLTLKNCYVDGHIQGTVSVGGLAGSCQIGHIENCYSKSTVNGGSASDTRVGGIVGYASDSVVLINCFSTGSISGTGSIGGLVGWCNGTINKCYSIANITGSVKANSLVGHANSVNGGNNAYLSGTTSGVESISTALSLDEIKTIYTNAYMGYTSSNGWKNSGSNLELVKNIVPINFQKTEFSLQIGVNSNSSSRINIKIDINLGSIQDLLIAGIEKEDVLQKIDQANQLVNNQKLKIGSAQNRLISALDEISTQYENLVSSRSTLQDADIAEVSSEYIRQQILQQASATLLSTANQSASIALSLI